MKELINRLKRLPKESLTCQGAILNWPVLVSGDDGRPFQLSFPLWVNVESGLVYTHPDAFRTAEREPLGAAWKALVEFVEQLTQGRAWPQRIEVRDPELAEYLRSHLAGTGVNVTLTRRLAALEAATANLMEMIDSEASGPPSLIDSRGVTVDRVRSFAEAAAAFYRAAPWRYLSDSDLLGVESPKPPRGMACFVVLGAGRDAFGLGLYPDRRSYERFLRAGQEGDYGASISAGLSQVLFDRLEEMTRSDATLWTEHKLPVAGDQAYPLAMKYGRDGRLARPTKTELAFLEGILRALADTSESEIDSGRWSKEVMTADGRRALTLCIPDLLDPPSPQGWIQRGFFPDQRTHERLFADMSRYLEENSPTGSDELAMLNQVFGGRSLDEPLTQPRSAREQAQDLCFAAFDTHGRRRVHLARRAIEIYPDCADAHVILAEHAASLEDQLQHYRRGMEAAERALGPEFFAESVGHFWGIAKTRPYMRARLGAAETLNAIGRAEEGIEHYRDLLRLNPNDNQGVRYGLVPALLAAGRDVEAARLLKEYNEQSAVWAYAQVLLAFRLSGRTEAAARELRAALRINPHVPELLASDLPIPRPPHYAPGSFEEACIAAEEMRAAFQATPGAVDWIAGESTRHAQALDKVRREKRRKERAKQKKRKRR